jgi:tetratricopeptide (TPR) repeat protein
MSKDLSQQQWTVIIVLVVALFVAVGVAAVLGSETKGPAGLTSGKRFTAKAGTSRENAVVLSSRNRGFMSGGNAAGTGSGSQAPEAAAPPPPPADTKPLRVRSISGVEDDADLTDTERAIREAENALSPRDGLEKLQATLEEATTDDERAAVYAAMAGLAAELDPPDYALADQHYDMARTYARTPKAAARTARAESNALLLRGEWGRARHCVEQALGAGNADPLDTAALQNTLGLIAEHEGNAESARAAYGAAFDAARSASDTGKERELLLRHAGLMLARSHRAAGNTEAATAAADSLNEALLMGVGDAPGATE